MECHVIQKQMELSNQVINQGLLYPTILRPGRAKDTVMVTKQIKDIVMAAFSSNDSTSL
jgi:hypothetical protein